MKLKIKALALSLILVVSAIGMTVYAEEETDAAEPVSEFTEEVADAEELTSEDASDDTSDDVYEDVTEQEAYINLLANYLSQISDWSDEQLDVYMESEDEVTALVALNWSQVRQELGTFEEVTEITEIAVSESILGGSVTGIAQYSDIGKGGTVYVTLDYVYTYSSSYEQYVMNLENISWNIDYTLGAMMQKAALNTLMGIVIVFCVLAFLIFLISRLKYIPGLFDRSGKKESEQAADTAPAPEAAPAPVSAAETTEEADDLELIAVISAAVAAYEESQGGSGDSYVVRSIKKVNNKNRRRA